MDAAQRGIEIRNPVEHRVGEDRIELVLERQRLRVELSRIDPARDGGCHEVRRRIDADHRRAGPPRSSASGAITAADVENAFASRGASRSSTGCPRSDTNRALAA